MQTLTPSCHFLHVRSKYLPHHPILEYLQSLFVRQPGRPSFTPICNIRRKCSSLIEGISNILFVDKKNIFYVQNSTSLSCNSTFSVFSVLIHKQYDTFWRPSQNFLYIYDRCITFFMKASQVPSYSTLHQTPTNTLHVLLTTSLSTDVKYI
jgi:hypothetical protein